MAAPARSFRETSFAAQAAALRQVLVTLALEVAGVEDELATTLEARARTNTGRADELRQHAAAARRQAASEREAARRFSAV